MTVTETPHAPQRSARRGIVVVSVAWSLLPLCLGLPAAPCFAWAAHRRRQRALAIEALGYAVVTVAAFAMSTQHPLGTAAGFVFLALMAVATVRAFMVRRAVFGLDPEPAPGVPTAPPNAAVWQQPAPDPNVPATWTTPFHCTGYDQHRLSLPLSRTMPMAALGAALTAFDVWFHITGRGLGAGIGLMLAPLLVAMSTRRVNGPVLYYRNGAAQHQLRLDQVTDVSARLMPRQGISLRLTAPNLKRPVSVTIRAAGWVATQEARDHLRGWLDRPGVRISPDAAEVLRSGTFGGTPVHLPRRHRRAWAAAWILTPVIVAGAVGASVYLADHNRGDSAIQGAPGYSTMTGPHGKPLAVGRPWGMACEPLLFAADQQMPDAVYQQLAQVVGEARALGLNVTLESRSFTWYPSDLRIPAGMPTSQVPQVDIRTTTAAAPNLSSGRPERIGEGWDARLDADGRHEDLTYAQGTLYLSTVGGSPLAERTALRELVAFAEGVVPTSQTDSGIRHDATLDGFSADDAHAMHLMSGCS